MSYTITYLVNGKRKSVVLNDFQGSEMKRLLQEDGTHIAIGEDTTLKKHVQIERDSEHQVKKGDLRSDLNRACNLCRVCNRKGFVLMTDGQMHPCQCQIQVKQTHGKDGYDYCLLSDENVKTEVKLLEPEKETLPKALDEFGMRRGMIKAIKTAIKTNPKIKPEHFFAGAIGRYVIAPEEVGLESNAW